MNLFTVNELLTKEDVEPLHIKETRDQVSDSVYPRTGSLNKMPKADLALVPRVNSIEDS